MNATATKRLQIKARVPTRIAPLLIALLVGTAAISSQVAGQGAATTGAAAKIDATKIGAARAIENEVEGRLGNAVQKLAVGSEVFQNQLVRTGKASTAQLQFLDETNLGLSPHTQIRLDSFVYDPDKKTGKVVLNVPRGIVRFVTGSLEKRSYTVRTPFVAVGVRGTTFDMLVRSDRVTVLLLDGGVELTVHPRGSYVLDRPNTAITIWRDGRVTGPRDWNRSVTDFAALPPSPAQRRAAAPPAPARPAATQAAAPAPGGSSGVASDGTNTARSSSAMDRITGDGMGGGAGGAAPGSPGLRLQGSSGGPGRSGGSTVSRGSSGASSVQSGGSSSSSGFDKVQASGTSVPRPSQGSSGTLRTNRPSNIEIFRQQQPPPSDAYRYRVN